MIARTFALALFGLGIGAILYGAVFYRFEHPDLTETQLLLANWPRFVVGLAAIGGYLLLESRRA